MSSKGFCVLCFILIRKTSLNNHSFINLELQVRNEQNWPERSLVYLCRLFDNLHTGNDYVEVKPACHIGILDFTLFPKQAEFYASYKLLNEKNHREYSDKFTLRVLDLTQIQMATEEDKAYGLDRWAKLFKATTWEEFKMIAADDKISRKLVKPSSSSTGLTRSAICARPGRRPSALGIPLISCYLTLKLNSLKKTPSSRRGILLSWRKILPSPS